MGKREGVCWGSLSRRPVFRRTFFFFLVRTHVWCITSPLHSPSPHKKKYTRHHSAHAHHVRAPLLRQSHFVSVSIRSSVAKLSSARRERPKIPPRLSDGWRVDVRHNLHAVVHEEAVKGRGVFRLQAAEVHVLVDGLRRGAEPLEGGWMGRSTETRNTYTSTHMQGT